MGLCAYSAALYAADLFGAAGQTGAVFLAAALLGVLLSLVMLYRITQGVAETETRREAALGAEELRAAWTWLAVSQIAAAISAGFLPPIAVVCLIAAVVCALVFLIRFSRTKRCWEALTEQKRL